ncbi:unnamed protein product [Danaus chrysippus]|uniref:(African queen) hypothetical protein n=1 Tax=Danaus chrysippus TaxID=151541 RepID=A0A8J2VVP2_9NEOP|nr:unnamed protein product [Danaus chrysippus]
MAQAAPAPQRTHSFAKKTFHKPTYCHHCSDLLWGLIGQGYGCEGTRRACAPRASIPPARSARPALCNSPGVSVPRPHSLSPVPALLHLLSSSSSPPPPPSRLLSPTVLLPAGSRPFSPVHLHSSPLISSPLLHMACKVEQSSQMGKEHLVVKSNSAPPLVGPGDVNAGLPPPPGPRRPPASPAGPPPAPGDL